MLPTLAHDETLFSWCATGYRYAGGLRAEAWAQHLLGSAQAMRQHEFPRGMPWLLVHHLPDLKAEDAARYHTVAGLGWGFVAASERTRMLGRGLADPCKWRHPSGTVRRCLLNHSRSLSVSWPLKFCPECVRRDEAHQGRGYWHTGHQWPTSCWCRLHGRPLCSIRRGMKSWLLPDEALCAKEIAVADVPPPLGERLAAVSEAFSRLDEVDLGALRHAMRHRLQQEGVLHSMHAVRHARLERWFQGQAVSAWCRSHMPALADGGWLARLIWRQRQDHPIRWILAWCALEWPDADGAAQAIHATQRGFPIDDQGQYSLFPVITPRGRRRDPAPLKFKEALQMEASYAGLMRRLGATRADIVRWLESEPQLRGHWRARRLEGLLARAEEILVAQIASTPEMTRDELSRACGAAMVLLRRHAPLRADNLLSAVRSRTLTQAKLW